MRGNAEGVGLFHLPVAKYKVVVVFPLTTIGLLNNAYVVDTLKAVMATHEKRTVEEIEVALKLFEVQARADNTAYVTCVPTLAKRILAASGCRDITFSCESIEMHVLQVPVQADHKIEELVQIAKPDYGFAYKRKEEVVLKLRYSTDAKRQVAHAELTGRNYIVPLPLPLFAVEGLSDATTEDDVKLLCTGGLGWEIEAVFCAAGPGGQAQVQVQAKAGPTLRHLAIQSDIKRHIEVRPLDKAAEALMPAALPAIPKARVREADVRAQITPEAVLNAASIADQLGAAEDAAMTVVAGDARTLELMQAGTRSGFTPDARRQRLY